MEARNDCCEQQRITHTVRKHPCSVAIVLSSDYGNEPSKYIYHSGDLLTGELSISCETGLVIDDILLWFEGTTRTWVEHSDYVSAVQHDFLKQSQQISPQQLKRKITSEGHHYWVRFKFRLAARCFPDEGLNPQLTLLPPSMKAGDLSLDHRGNECMQPLIVYGLRAIIACRHEPLQVVSKFQHFREVDFMPLTKPWPPTSIEDFPGEFQMSRAVDLRKRITRSPIGTLTASLDEPRPLQVHTQEPSAPCKAEGMLSIILRTSHTLHARPPWCVAVQLQIIRKIYYSTMPLGEVASTRFMRTHKFMKLRNEVVHLHSWKIDPLTWEYGISADNSRGEICIANLPLPITPKRRLSPTFCSPLATVRYSVKVALRIVDTTHPEIVVEAPLQVLSCREIDNDNCTSDATSPIAHLDDHEDDATVVERPPPYFR